MNFRPNLAIHGRFLSMSGFTLIEILIVIVIISIVSSTALITISNNQRKQLENTAIGLTNIMALAKEEAMLRPATLGLAFLPGQFQFFKYETQLTETEEKNNWVPLTDKNLGAHSLASNIHVQITVQGKSAPLNGKPYIIISESGDVSPFVISIGKKDSGTALFQVKGDASGKIIWEEVHDQP